MANLVLEIERVGNLRGTGRPIGHIQRVIRAAKLRADPVTDEFVYLEMTNAPDIPQVMNRVITADIWNHPDGFDADGVSLRRVLVKRNTFSLKLSEMPVLARNTLLTDGILRRRWNVARAWLLHTVDGHAITDAELGL